MTAKPPGAKPIALVVRRGALRRFDALTQKTSDLPVDVVWDKRLAERRASEAETEQERRNNDRRQEPSFTWQLADFVVVEKGPIRPRTPRSDRKKRP